MRREPARHAAARGFNNNGYFVDRGRAKGEASSIDSSSVRTLPPCGIAGAPEEKRREAVLFMNWRFNKIKILLNRVEENYDLTGNCEIYALSYVGFTF